MSAGTKASELRELGNEELLAKLREAKEELFNLRFQAATGQLGRLGTGRHHASPASRLTIRHFIGSLWAARVSASRAIFSLG